MLSGRAGGYAGFALAQITKNNKLTLVSDPGGATASFDAVAVIIVWDLGNIDQGWYNGVIAWNGLDITRQTVDHMSTAGVAGSGKEVFSIVNADIPVLTASRIGEAISYIKAGDASYVGTSGNYTATLANFDQPRSCARPTGVAPPPLSCVYQLGTMTGSFNFVAQKFSGAGGATFTQPAATFNLPAVQVIISAN